MDDLLTHIFTSQWQVAAFVSIVLLLAAEIGFRIGRRDARRLGDPQKGQIGAMQGTSLGLLALLLGFTFALAVQRYDSRRALVLQEANSIGTTFLRASFLPASHRRPVEALLRRYIDVRLDYANAGEDEARIAAAEKAAADLQAQLWAHAVSAGQEASTPFVAQFITSLNETIDCDASRVAALRNHVPTAVWLLVLLVAAVGCGACGDAVGVNGARLTVALVVPPLLIAAVITILVDIDSPRRGLISASQQSMVDLKATLATSPTSP